MHMEKIKGTLQEQLALEKESKQLAEQVLKATYAQAALDGKAGETKVGSKLMEHVFSDCYDNVKNVLFPQKKRGVVPKYQGVVNQLKALYEGDEDTLIKMSVTTILNTLIGAVLHSAGDTYTYLDCFMNGLADDFREEVTSYEYLKNATRQDGAFFEDGLKHRGQKEYKVQYAHKAYKDMGFTPQELDTTNLYKLLLVLVDAVLKGSGYFEYLRDKKGTVTDKEYPDYLQSLLSFLTMSNKAALSEYGVRFNTEFVPAENLGVKNAKWDKEAGLYVPRDCYNSYFYPVENTKVNVLDKLKLYSKDIVQYLDGGSALHLNLEQMLSAGQFVHLYKLCSKYGVQYWTTNVLCTICNECGYINTDTETHCVKCGSMDVDYGTRVIGYLKRISNFSEARQKEAGKRFYHHLKK